MLMNNLMNSPTDSNSDLDFKDFAFSIFTLDVIDANLISCIFTFLAFSLRCYSLKYSP